MFYQCINSHVTKVEIFGATLITNSIFNTVNAIKKRL